MFSMCSELTPRAHIPDTRIPQLMQPWPNDNHDTDFGDADNDRASLDDNDRFGDGVGDNDDGKISSSIPG